MNKKNMVTILIVIGVLILSFIILNREVPTTSAEVAKCIGERALIYTQLGCHACKTQEEMFGENYKFLDEIDCFYEKEKCEGIEATPTWVIQGQKYKGVQTIEKLQELTGC